MCGWVGSVGSGWGVCVCGFVVCVHVLAVRV